MSIVKKITSLASPISSTISSIKYYIIGFVVSILIAYIVFTIYENNSLKEQIKTDQTAILKYQTSEQEANNRIQSLQQQISNYKDMSEKDRANNENRISKLKEKLDSLKQSQRSSEYINEHTESVLKELQQKYTSLMEK